MWAGRRLRAWGLRPSGLQRVVMFKLSVPRNAATPLTVLGLGLRENNSLAVIKLKWLPLVMVECLKYLRKTSDSKHSLAIARG